MLIGSLKNIFLVFLLSFVEIRPRGKNRPKLQPTTGLGRSAVAACRACRWSARGRPAPPRPGRRPIGARGRGYDWRSRGAGVQRLRELAHLSGSFPTLKSLLCARPSTMAALVALLRAGARGRSPLLRRQTQVSGAGTRGSACPFPDREGSRLRPRGRVRAVGLRVDPSGGPTSRKPPSGPPRAGPRCWYAARFHSREFLYNGLLPGVLDGPHIWAGWRPAGSCGLT